MRVFLILLFGVCMWAGTVGDAITQNKMFPTLSGYQIGEKQYLSGIDLLLSRRNVTGHLLVGEEAPRGGFAPLLIVTEEGFKYCIYSDLMSSPLQFDSPIYGLIAFYGIGSDAWIEILGDEGAWKDSAYSAVWKTDSEIEFHRNGPKSASMARGRIVESDHETRWLVLETAKGIPLGATIINNVPRVEVLGSLSKVSRTGAFKDEAIRNGFLRLFSGRVNFEGFPKIGSVVGVLP